MIKLCLELSRHFVVFICKHYISSPRQCLEIKTLRFISSSFHVSVPMSSTTSHATEYHTQPLKGGVLYFSSPLIRQELSWQARLTDGKLTDVEGYLTHAVVWEGTRINHQLAVTLNPSYPGLASSTQIEPPVLPPSQSYLPGVKDSNLQACGENVPLRW